MRNEIREEKIIILHLSEHKTIFAEIISQLANSFKLLYNNTEPTSLRIGCVTEYTTAIFNMVFCFLTRILILLNQRNKITFLQNMYKTYVLKKLQ